MDVKDTASIQVHIEELVLDGFKNSDRDAIAQALERELARLLQEHGVPAHLLQRAAPAEIDAGRVTIRSDARPTSVGTNAARAIHKGLMR